VFVQKGSRLDLAIPNRSKELVIPSMRAYTRRLRRPVYLFKTVVLYLLGV